MRSRCGCGFRELERLEAREEQHHLRGILVKRSLSSLFLEQHAALFVQHDQAESSPVSASTSQEKSIVNNALVNGQSEMAAELPVYLGIVRPAEGQVYHTRVHWRSKAVQIAISVDEASIYEESMY